MYTGNVAFQNLFKQILNTITYNRVQLFAKIWLIIVVKLLELYEAWREVTFTELSLLLPKVHNSY